MRDFVSWCAGRIQEPFAARSVCIVAVESADVSALTTALGGAHVVVSTVRLTEIDVQPPASQALRRAVFRPE